MSEMHYTGEKTLVWQVATPPKRINHGYSEQVMRALFETFGPFPITFGKDELRILRAMNRVSSGRPIGDLIELIEQHGEIRVWAIPGWSPTREEIAAATTDQPPPPKTATETQTR